MKQPLIKNNPKAFECAQPFVSHCRINLLFVAQRLAPTSEGNARCVDALRVAR